MKKLLLLALPLIIVGCGEDSERIDVVQNSYINEERTIQLGKLLNNRKICAKTDWQSATDDLGQNLVIYECKLLDQSKAFAQEKQRLLDDLRRNLELQLAQLQHTTQELEQLSENRRNAEIKRLKEVEQRLTAVENQLIDQPFTDTQTLGFDPYALYDTIVIERNLYVLEVKLPEVLQEIMAFPSTAPEKLNGEADYLHNSRVYQWKQDRHLLILQLLNYFRHSERYGESNHGYLGETPLLTKWVTSPNIHPNTPLKALSYEQIDFEAIRKNLPEINAELQRFAADLKLYKYNLLAATLVEAKQPIIQKLQDYEVSSSVEQFLKPDELSQYQYSITEAKRIAADLDHFAQYSADRYREYDYRNIIEKLIWVVNDKKETFFLGGLVEAKLGSSVEELIEYTNEDLLYYHLLDTREANDVMQYIGLD